MEGTITPTTISNQGSRAGSLGPQIDKVLQSQSSKDALRLISKFTSEPITPESGEELLAKKQRLRVVALSLLPSSELIDLFRGKLDPVFEYDVLDRLRLRLVSLPAGVQDELKREILHAIESNSNELVSGAIKTPAQWISDFRQANQPLEVYMQYSDKVKALPLGERLRIERLLQIIRLSSVSSELPEGMEDEMLVKDEAGQFRVLKAGELVNAGAEPEQKTPIASAPTPVFPRQSIRSTPAPVSAPLPVQTPTQKPETRKVLAPPPPAISKPTAEFYFDTDDEKEIGRHKTRLANLETTPDIDLDEIVNKLVRDFHIKLDDEIIEARFSSIIKSRLRDVRDLIETRQMLIRPVDVGGIGLSERVILPLMSQVEEELLRIHQVKPEPKPPKPAPTPETKKEITPPPPVKKVSVPPPAPPPVNLTVKPVVPPKKVEVKPEPKPEPKVISVEPKHKSPPPPSIKPVRVPKRPLDKTVIPVISRPVGDRRPTISDIKRPIKTIGPTEELAELSVEDYRRLGKTAEEANEKIIEKLDLMEEDSYLLRASGIKAWKKCAVNKLYLEIGRQSMEQDKPVLDIVRKRQELGQPYLSQSEFSAIADLNKKISF
ncbi:hypothetical protein KJ782_06235 [Patescibacteria group bacterium]|nr:hypothetical protein [Patescibacteria group bacterium]